MRVSAIDDYIAIFQKRGLEARPVATLSVEAQERREVSERQYSDQDDRYR